MASSHTLCAMRKTRISHSSRSAPTWRRATSIPHFVQHCPIPDKVSECKRKGLGEIAQLTCTRYRIFAFDTETTPSSSTSFRDSLPSLLNAAAFVYLRTDSRGSMVDPKRQQDSPPPLDADVVHASEIHDIGEEGSDMTRDIYVALFKDKDRVAVRSLPDVSDVLHEDIGKASDMAQPGGFRRGHVIATKGDDGANVPTYAQESFLDTISHLSVRDIVQSSYDEFVIANLGYGMSREEFYDEEGGDVRDLYRISVCRCFLLFYAKRKTHIRMYMFALCRKPTRR